MDGFWNSFVCDWRSHEGPVGTRDVTLCDGFVTSGCVLSAFQETSNDYPSCDVKLCWCDMSRINEWSNEMETCPKTHRFVRNLSNYVHSLWKRFHVLCQDLGKHQNEWVSGYKVTWCCLNQTPESTCCYFPSLSSIHVIQTQWWFMSYFTNINGNNRQFNRLCNTVASQQQGSESDSRFSSRHNINIG